MKLTKSKLKQIIKEELIKMNESRFNTQYNRLKSELQGEWEANDQQTFNQWTSPEEITASIIQSVNMEEEDLYALISDATEEYNRTHEDKIHVDVDEVFEKLRTQTHADYESQREDEATNSW